MKLSGKVRLIVIVVSVVVVVLVGGSLPWPKLGAPARTAVVRADGGCSLASLNGTYAVDRQGTIVAQLPGLPPPPAPFGEATIAHFNGAGTFFGSATVNIGGAVANPAFTGTYTVNRDCTGTVTVSVPSFNLTLHEAIVVIGGGQRYIGTASDSFEVVQARVERIGD